MIFKPNLKSFIATLSATKLEEQAVSMTSDGPLKSNTNDIRLD